MFIITGGVSKYINVRGKKESMSVLMTVQITLAIF